MEERFLTYSLRNDELVHISQVENGKACNCNCPNPKCRHPLIAKNNINNKKAPHFAHASGKECEGAYESALHLLAKALLFKYRKIKLPDFHHDYNVFNVKSLFKEGQEVTFEDIRLEQRVDFGDGFIVPDAIGVWSGRKVYIEFAYTHFVDEQKHEILKKLNVACFEIDLSETPLNEEAVLNLFAATSTFKSWLCNPHLDKQYQEHIKKEQEQKKIKEEEKKRLKEERLMREQEAIDKELLQFELDKVVAYKKYSQYRAEGKYRFLVSRWDRNLPNCPIRKEKITAMKTTGFYNHPVLKKIIDGAYWNGVVYGHPPSGKWIYIENKLEYIFPPDSKLSNRSDEVIRNEKLFFKGLIEIKSILESVLIGICSQCDYSVEKLTLEDATYEVCRYPK